MSFPAKSLPVKQAQDRAAVPPMTHEEALDVIGRASKDKYLSPQLDVLRDRCCDFINGLMHEVNLALAEKDKRTPALLKSRVDSALSLRAAAAEREEAARRRRELAEAMVLGALINIDNPEWDPFDPASSRTATQDNVLIALIKSAFR